MLFLVTHTHTPDLCPVDDPKPVAQMADEGHIRSSGVKVVGSYIAPPEHVMFFILEAADPAPMIRFLRPLMKIGSHRITPIQTISEALGVIEGASPSRPTSRRAR